MSDDEKIRLIRASDVEPKGLTDQELEAIVNAARQPKPTADEIRANELFDYAVAKPDGFTYDDILADLGWPYQTFMRTVRTVRLTLGDDDDINLPCEPQGHAERWLYRLVGNPDDDGVRRWQMNRIEDMEARLTTIEAVSMSIVRGSDGRTVVGKKARLISSTVRHLRETLAVIGQA